MNRKVSLNSKDTEQKMQEAQMPILMKWDVRLAILKSGIKNA